MERVNLGVVYTYPVLLLETVSKTKSCMYTRTEDVMKSKLPGQRFKNPANTNVYYWGGKLLATWESGIKNCFLVRGETIFLISTAGLPYALDPVTLETQGKETLNGVLKESRCLAAHFRYDPFTDRLVTFR